MVTEAEIQHAREVVAAHEKTGDPYTGAGAEWLCVFARRYGVSDEALTLASRETDAPKESTDA